MPQGNTHIPCDGEWFSGWDDLVERRQVDWVATWVGSDRQLRAGRSKARQGDSNDGYSREIHLDVRVANVQDSDVLSVVEMKEIKRVTAARYKIKRKMCC